MYDVTKLVTFSAVLSVNMIISPLLLIQRNPLYSRDIALIFDSTVDLFYVMFNGIVMVERWTEGEEVTASFLGQDERSTGLSILSVLSVCYPTIRATMSLSRVMISLGRGKARSQKEIVQHDALFGKRKSGSSKSSAEYEAASSQRPRGRSVTNSWVNDVRWKLVGWRVFIGVPYACIVCSGFILFHFRPHKNWNSIEDVLK